MIKGKLLTALVIIGSLVIPFSVFAATPGSPEAKPVKGFFNIDTSKLTDKQKADINATIKKIDALDKEFIDTAVNNGLITKAQGDTLKNKRGGTSPAGADKPFGIVGRSGLLGMGCLRLFENDSSKLTDQQKKDIEKYSQKLNVLRKELVGKYVSTGAITKEQGDNILERMERKADPESHGRHGKGMKIREKGQPDSSKSSNSIAS